MQDDWDIETEIVVVGAGACGLMATYRAARAGADVVLIEKDTRVGSNTELASGSIPAAGTRFQKALGIAGTAQQMADDIQRKNKGRSDPAIVNELCRRSVEIIDVLVDEIGLSLELNTDSSRFGFSFLRLHNPVGRTGAPMIRAFHKAIEQQSNVTFADRTPGCDLILGEQGDVIGVVAGARERQRIKARKVILATDGFGANREMVSQYIPEMDGVDCIGTQNNTGDGLRWAIRAGAATANMGAYQGHGLVCAGYGTRLVPEIAQLGAVIVNMAGDRFAREDQGYSEFARVVLGQPGGIALAIFDQKIFDVVARLDHFQETLASGAIRSAPDVDSLAGLFRVPAENVRNSINACAQDCALGADAFGRAVKQVPSQGPFYGAKITGTLAHTQGGLVVDVNARVMRRDGTCIPNLYAGGGSAAGISGDGPDGYLSGNGLLSALGLGLIAGEHAASAIRGTAPRA